MEPLRLLTASVAFLGLHLLIGCQTTTERGAIPISASVKAAYQEFDTRGDKAHPQYFAVSRDGNQYGASYGNGLFPEDYRKFAIEECQSRARVSCVILADKDRILWRGPINWNSSASVDDSEWVHCLERLADGSARWYRALHECQSGDTRYSKSQLRYLENVLSTPPMAEGLTLRPTLRDRPDRDLCKSLAYGNPDYMKEAKRRGLTSAKCREILNTR